MNRATVAAVGSLGVVLVTGCTGRIDSATNATQVAAALTAAASEQVTPAAIHVAASRRPKIRARGRRLRRPRIREKLVNLSKPRGLTHPGLGMLGAPAPGGLPVRQRVCMNTHMNYTGSSYGDVAAVRAKLDYLGVDCIRDVLPPDANLVSQPRRFNELGRQVIAICGGYSTTWWWENNEARCVSEARARISRLVAVEGMNEPYCQDRGAFNANQTRLRNHMVRMRDGAAGTGIAVYSVSMCHPEWYTAAAVPGIVNTMHSYSPPGQFPRMGPASSSDSVESWMSRSRFSDSGQFASTEIGTYDPVTALGGDQTLMARYQLIHTLNHLYKGVQRFAFYELQDWGAGGEDFGFWDANGGRRLAADAIRNLLALLGEARTGPTLGFTYTVSDPANPGAPPVGAGTGWHPVHRIMEPAAHRGQEPDAAPERGAASHHRAADELHHRGEPRRVHRARRVARRRPPDRNHPPLKD
jgi:hypothetical protein